MKNYIQEGDSLVLTAPYARNAGQGALIGALFAVALSDIANAATGVFTTQGVFELDKAGSQAWAEGVKVYWDNTNKVVTTTATSNTLIGCAVAAADSAATTGIVRLNGTV